MSCVQLVFRTKSTLNMEKVKILSTSYNLLIIFPLLTQTVCTAYLVNIQQTLLQLVN